MILECLDLMKLTFIILSQLEVIANDLFVSAKLYILNNN